MSAWGNNSSFRSCEALLQRIQAGDPTLKELIILSVKTFGNAEAVRLAEALAQSPHLRTLSASGHVLSIDSYQRLGAAIAESNVQELALGHADMGDDGLHALCHAIGTQSRLRRVDFSYKSLTSQGFNIITTTVGASEALRDLNLSRNNLSSAVNLSPLSSVEELDLSDCQLLQMDSVLTCFTNRLRILRLTDNPFGNAGLSTLLQCPDLAQVEELYMGNCQLSDAAMTSLQQYPLPMLKHLDLARNRLSSSGATTLAEALASMPLLQQLILDGNPIGALGTLAIVQPLTDSSRMLASLDLATTNCGVEGAVAALSVSMSVRLLDNQLGAAGFQAIAECFRQERVNYLESLDLAGNQANQVSVVDLLTALRDTAHELQLLVIGANASGEAVDQIVSEVKRVHPKLCIGYDKKQQR